MAGCTTGIYMRASKRESRAVVVKGDRFPTCGGVTSRAIRSILSAMPVILCVAGITICGRALEDLVDMAFGAVNACV